MPLHERVHPIFGSLLNDLRRQYSGDLRATERQHADRQNVQPPTPDEPPDDGATEGTYEVHEQHPTTFPR